MVTRSSARGKGIEPQITNVTLNLSIDNADRLLRRKREGNSFEFTFDRGMLADLRNVSSSRDDLSFEKLGDKKKGLKDNKPKLKKKQKSPLHDKENQGI